MIDRLFRYPPWAHHPTCSCFDGHLLRFGSFAVCLGCACLAVGILGCALFLMWAWNEEPWLLHRWGLLGVGVLCWLPTLVQPFCQAKAFKIASRLLLGCSLPCLMLAGLFLPPLDAVGMILRLLFVLVFVVVYVLSMRLRKRFTPDPCASCPHGRWPFCAENMPRVRQQLKDEPELLAQIELRHKEIP